MLSPITKRNIFRIIPFGLIWFFFSIIYLLLEKGLLGDLETYPSTGNPYDFSSNILITGFSAIVAGLVIGSIEIFYLSKVFNNQTLGKKIIYKTLVYIGMMIIFLLFNTAVSNSIELNANITNKRLWQNM